MAIFSKKTEEQKAAQAEEQQAQAPVGLQPKVVSVAGIPMLILPRMSEKSSALAGLNKFVFKVGVNANKVEVRKAIEKSYGVKVASVNMIRMEGKNRRYGRSTGKTSDFKKAIVTLTKDSKKLDIAE